MAAITNRTDATIDLEEQEKVIKKEICIEVENGSIANRPMNENYEDAPGSGGWDALRYRTGAGIDDEVLFLQLQASDVFAPEQEPEKR